MSKNFENPGGTKRLHAPSGGNGPGATALQRILYLAHSAAMDFVKVNTPPLAAADGIT